jgi:hypothetical protein
MNSFCNPLCMDVDLKKCQNLVEIEWISTQRTRAGVARLKPFKQAARMEKVLAGRATLGRQLFVATDDRVANGALGLTFECSSDVFPPGRQAVDDAAVLYRMRLAMTTRAGRALESLPKM